MPLVISQNLVLSEAAAALPAGTPIILWDNRVTFSNVSVDVTSETGYPITNLSNPATDPTQEWRADTAEAVEITVAVNTVDEIDGVGIARHNFGSEGITVEIGYYDTDTSPPTWVQLVQEQLLANDEPALFQFTPTSLTELVIRLGEGDAEARLAVLYVGPLLICERGPDIGAGVVLPRFGRRTDMVQGRAERGDFLGRIKTGEWIETQLAFKHFHADWYREYFDPFVAAAQEDVPFFITCLPDDYPAEAAYCWLTDDPQAETDPQTGRIHSSIKFGGIVE